MSYLDCAVNPLIYCSHKDFREAGMALLWTKAQSEPVLTAVTPRDVSLLQDNSISLTSV